MKIRDHRQVEYERISRFAKLKAPAPPSLSLVDEIRQLAGNLKHVKSDISDSDLARLEGNLSAENFQVKLLQLSVGELAEEATTARRTLEELKTERDQLDAEIPDLQLQVAGLNEEQDNLSAELLDIATSASEEMQGLMEAIEAKKKLLEQLTLEREMVDYESLKIMAEIRYAQSVLVQSDPDLSVDDSAPSPGGFVERSDSRFVQSKCQVEPNSDEEEQRIYGLIDRLNQLKNR